MLLFFLVKVCIFIICDFVCCSDLLDKEKPTFRYQPVEVILDKFVTVTYHHHHHYYYQSINRNSIMLVNELDHHPSTLYSNK